MPVTKVGSRWVGGDLIFHDKATLAASGYVLRIAENELQAYMPLISSSRNGFRSTAVFVPDQYRTDYAFAVGFREPANELNVTMAGAANQNFDPIQVNLNIIGAGAAAGTVNASYMLITHDTTAMASLRLKCADWNVVVGVNVQDAYVYQGEIDFNAANIVVGGEAAVLGLTMNAGTQAVTGNLRGLIISMQGNGGMPAGAMGIEIRSTCTTRLAQAIGLKGTPQPQVGIAMGDRGNDNEGPQSAFFFPTGPSGDEGPVRHSVQTGNGEGSIQIKVGSGTKYLKYWTSPS